MPRKLYIKTFGCQMNVHDSEKVIGTLEQQGYSQVQTEEEADLILYNTCSVREHAEQIGLAYTDVLIDRPFDAPVHQHEAHRVFIFQLPDGARDLFFQRFDISSARQDVNNMQRGIECFGIG